MLVIKQVGAYRALLRTSVAQFVTRLKTRRSWVWKYRSRSACC